MIQIGLAIPGFLPARAHPEAPPPISAGVGHFPMAYLTELLSKIRPASDFQKWFLCEAFIMRNRNAPSVAGQFDLTSTKIKISARIRGSKQKRANIVRLAFNDEGARAVSIAGTFNDWNPGITPMLSNGSGQWIKELSLRPGIYEYQYVVDGKWVNDPQAIKSTPNPYGGRNSVFVVEESISAQGTPCPPRTAAREAKTVGGQRKDNNHAS